MTADLRQQWQAIVTAFPWEPCAAVFAARGWVYCHPEADILATRVPGVIELKACCDELFANCLETLGNKRENWSASGRFMVRIVDGVVSLESQAIDAGSYAEAVKDDPILSIDVSGGSK